jgi:hypothetical protein
MKGEVEMTRPELALVLGTRAALFVGLGLLLASRFSSAEKRSAVGRTLMLTGLFTGVCISSQIFGGDNRPFKLKFGSPSRSPTRTGQQSPGQTGHQSQRRHGEKSLLKHRPRHVKPLNH